MREKITFIIIAAMTAAFFTTAATCQCVKSRGRAQAEEAGAQAEEAEAQAREWERRARAYAESLERAEEARRRAERSAQKYEQAFRKAEETGNDARQILEEMRGDGDDCGWLDGRLPDRVRDIAALLYPRSGCD